MRRQRIGMHFVPLIVNLKLKDMKTTLSVFAIIFLSTSIQAQPEKEIKAELKHVTVFPDRAQLSHEGSLQIVAGKSVLKLTALSPYIDQQSIQVKGYGDFTILSVNQRNNYLENLEDLPEVKELRAQVEQLQLKSEDEKAAIKVLQEKENFYVANRAILVRDNPMTVEQMKAMTDMYSAGIEQVTTALLKKNRLVREYEKQIAALQKQIAERIGRQQLPSGEILITVTADKPANARLAVSYVVSNAGWYPSYDIRVDDITRPVSINYKANVFQSTGVPWKDVKLSFSNATPWVAGNLPELYPWFVDYYVPVSLRPVTGVAYGRAKKADAPMQAKAEALSEVVVMEREAESSPVQVDVREGETTVVFDIAVPYTIPSDGKLQTVEMQRLETEADFKYVATPKLSPHTYLTASIRDWARLKLQSGEATLYFENAFVGKSDLSINQLSDSLLLSLGTDAGILIKRDKRKDFTSTRVIGSNKTETFSWLITLRNNKKSTVRLKLSDQIPVSSNSGITVEAVELSGGTADQAGTVAWDLTLKPQETRELVLTYSVRYPKDKKVILE